jgi:hypothetical protein
VRLAAEFGVVRTEEAKQAGAKGPNARCYAMHGGGWCTATYVSDINILSIIKSLCKVRHADSERLEADLLVHTYMRLLAPVTPLQPGLSHAACQSVEELCTL